MNYRALVLFLCFFLISLQDHATEKDTTLPEPVVLTNEESSYRSFEEAEKNINTFMKKWGLNGASVAIVKDGRLVYTKGFGYADREKDQKVSPVSTFRVASVSKLITAIAIMKLSEEGKLSVDDKVFGPEGILNDEKFEKTSDKRFYDITVEHLLVHEGGWDSKYGDQMFMPHYIAKYMGKKLPVDADIIIQFALKKGLHFAPGSAISYSNLGYVVLGKIIEKVSGMGYEEYVTREVLNPIGINGMRITSNKYEEKGPFEVKYYDVPGAKYRLSVYSTKEYAPKTYEGTDYITLGPAGGWTATSAELMKLLLAVDGHATGEDILSCSTIDSMTTLDNPDKYGYGWVHSDNKGNWWRTGTLAGTSAFVMRRCDGISYAFITNTSTHRGSQFAYDIKDMMEEAISTVSWWPSVDLFPLFLKTEISLSSTE